MSRATTAALLLLAGTAHAADVSLTMDAHLDSLDNSAWVAVAPLPAGSFAATNIQGTLDVVMDDWSFGEELYVLSTMPGTCPAAGQVRFSWEPPGATALGLWIVKASEPGSHPLPLNIPLPTPLPLSNCLVLAAYGAGGSATLTSSLTLTYTNLQVPEPTGVLIGTGLEACYGGTTGTKDWGASPVAGCNSGQLNGPAVTNWWQSEYANIVHITTPLHVLAAYGSDAAAAFDAWSGLTPPAGLWSFWADTYLVHPAQCAKLPAKDGVFGRANWDSKIVGTEDILSSTQDVEDQGSNQQPLSQPLNLHLVPGDCLVTVIAAQVDWDGNPGNVDVEVQRSLLAVPE